MIFKFIKIIFNIFVSLATDHSTCNKNFLSYIHQTKIRNLKIILFF